MGALAAAALGTGVGLAIVYGHLFGSLEQQTLAARFALRPQQHPNGVAIVAIDDRSFAELHRRWPFPRSWHARVLEQLHRAGARAVFYDVQFTEPTTPAEDTALYDALGRTGGAVLATTQTDGQGHSSVLGGDANLRAVDSQAAASDFPVGAGGMISRVPFQLKGLQTPAVVLAERLNGSAPARSLFSGDGAYIDYQGPPGTFPSVSFADVLRGHFSPDLVRGKVIVVGATSPTLQDLHATAATTQSLMSGAEVQANAIWTVLHGVPLRPPPPGLVIALITLAALSAAMVRLGQSAAMVAVAGSLVTAIFLVGVQLVFDAGVVVPVVGTVGALLTSAAAAILASHLLMTRELHATQLEIVQRLGRAAESRDGATGRHLERIGFLCERLALAAGLSRREAKLLRQASALHDVGKIGIPDHVLLKTGLFDDSDRTIMSTHTVRGARLLAGSSTSLVQMAEIIALTHHERWNGTGYPAGLAGEEIPLPGRICAICDVFDALVSKRPYKEAWTIEAALAEIEREAGDHFDPRLAALFLRIAPRLYDELSDQPHDDMTGLHPESVPFRGPTAGHEPPSFQDPVSDAAGSPLTAASPQ
jgi:HD-GYP domain-containing protein (c-di-GMP phosphodiesterase class II)